MKIKELKEELERRGYQHASKKTKKIELQQRLLELIESEPEGGSSTITSQNNMVPQKQEANKEENCSAKDSNGTQETAKNPIENWNEMQIIMQLKKLGYKGNTRNRNIEELRKELQDMIEKSKVKSDQKRNMKEDHEEDFRSKIGVDPSQVDDGDVEFHNSDFDYMSAEQLNLELWWWCYKSHEIRGKTRTEQQQMLVDSINGTSGRKPITDCIRTMSSDGLKQELWDWGYRGEIQSKTRDELEAAMFTLLGKKPFIAHTSAFYTKTGQFQDVPAPMENEPRYEDLSQDVTEPSTVDDDLLEGLADIMTAPQIRQVLSHRGYKKLSRKLKRTDLEKLLRSDIQMRREASSKSNLANTPSNPDANVPTSDDQMQRETSSKSNSENIPSNPDVNVPTSDVLASLQSLETFAHGSKINSNATERLSPDDEESCRNDSPGQQSFETVASLSDTHGVALLEADPLRRFVLRSACYTKENVEGIGIGIILRDLERDCLLWSTQRYLPKSRSLYEAGYSALVFGLRFAVQKYKLCDIHVQIEQDFIVDQLLGLASVEEQNLKPMFDEVVTLKEEVLSRGCFSIEFITRLQNNETTHLAQAALTTGFSEVNKDQVIWKDPLRFSAAYSNVSPISPLSSLNQEENRKTLAAETVLSSFKNEINSSSTYLLQFDGGSRSNPGVAGAGMALLDENGHEIWCGGKYLGDSITNNQAEYSSLILGLQRAQYLGIKQIRCVGDSELVIKQLNGQYKVKHEGLRSLWNSVQKMVKQFDSCEFQHVPRRANHRADELANKAMDKRTAFGFD
jgi:ribonuclease HI